MGARVCGYPASLFSTCAAVFFKWAIFNVAICPLPPDKSPLAASAPAAGTWLVMPDFLHWCNLHFLSCLKPTLSLSFSLSLYLHLSVYLSINSSFNHHIYILLWKSKFRRSTFYICFLNSEHYCVEVKGQLQREVHGNRKQNLLKANQLTN